MATSNHSSWPRLRKLICVKDVAVMEKTRVLIMGAAGRDFHHFNVVYGYRVSYELQEIGKPDLEEVLRDL